jgi:hypothetical protein
VKFRGEASSENGLEMIQTLIRAIAEGNRAELRKCLDGYVTRRMPKQFPLLSAREAEFLLVAAEFLGEGISVDPNEFRVASKVFIARMGCSPAFVTHARSALAEKGFIKLCPALTTWEGRGVPKFVINFPAVLNSVTWIKLWNAGGVRQMNPYCSYRANDNRPKPRR